MGKTLSCGVVVLNEHGGVLLCHATETRHWDIPKGMGEGDETPLVTALREMDEETGVVIDGARLLDLGRFDYRADKTLHLFAARVTTDEVDIEACFCRSMFPSFRDGRMIPEMDAFRWVEPARVAEYASGSLNRLFETRLSLVALDRRLTAGPGRRYS
jgi:predicted NUDIX family NTP pyrophosphohydrolase